jgi:DNA-binding transcriptional MerR regulator
MTAPRRPSPAPAAPPRESTYTISQLAAEFALTTRAIRFYEDEGLLAPRRNGQARVYGERERTRIKLILRGKRLGLSLVEIREILDLHDTREGDRRQLLRFLEALEHRRSQLEVQRSDIDALLLEIASIERDCRRRLKETAADRAAPGGARTAARSAAGRGADGTGRQG